MSREKKWSVDNRRQCAIMNKFLVHPATEFEGLGPLLITTMAVELLYNFGLTSGGSKKCRRKLSRVHRIFPWHAFVITILVLGPGMSCITWALMKKDQACRNSGPLGCFYGCFVSGESFRQHPDDRRHFPTTIKQPKLIISKGKSPPHWRPERFEGYSQRTQKATMQWKPHHDNQTENPGCMRFRKTFPVTSNVAGKPRKLSRDRRILSKLKHLFEKLLWRDFHTPGDLEDPLFRSELRCFSSSN